MPDEIETLLREIGPCVSGKLVVAIAERHQIRPDAARQRLSRSKAVKRLGYVRFPKNARFVYLQSDYASPVFWAALAKALLDETNAYGGAIAALLARGGMIPLAHFASACGSPIAQKGHLSAQMVQDHLVRAGLVQLVELPGLGSCVQLSEQAFPESWQVSRIRGRIHAEDVLLLAVKDWLRRLNMVSYNAVRVRSLDTSEQQPRVGTLNWDLSGPSHLAALTGWSTKGEHRPGFVACDVLLGRRIEARDLKPFVLKCETLRNLKNVASCLQVFVGEYYSPEALQLAKDKGIIPASPESLFGIEVAEALKQLTSLLHSAYDRVDNAEQIAEIFRRLKAVEGAATNLRGALFEFIVADLVRRSSIDTHPRLNEIVLDEQGRRAEVDVVAVRFDHSVRFIECKGYKPGGQIPDEMVIRWLHDRIPLIYSAAKHNTFWRKSSFSFEFWTTGVLSDAAMALIETAQKASVGKYSIALVAQPRLKAICEEFGEKSLQDTMHEHFFEHPLQTVARDIAKRIQREAKRTERRPPFAGNAPPSQPPPQ